MQDVFCNSRNSRIIRPATLTQVIEGGILTAFGGTPLKAVTQSRR